MSIDSLVKIWDMKFALIEQFEEFVDGEMCEGCSAPCEKGNFRVLLTMDEFLSGQYPIKIILIPELKEKRFPTQNAIGLFTNHNGCPFMKDNRCTIYEWRPKACRMYDCRKDPRPEIQKFVKERFGWQLQSMVKT